MTRLQQEMDNLARWGEMATVETVIKLYENGLTPKSNNPREDIRKLLELFFIGETVDYWMDYYGVK